jgi:hypothetical protein
MADYRTAGILNTDGSGTVNIGLEDNNPGDIKDDGTAWQGKVGSDGTFIIFADTTWGLRAMAVDLTTKINNDGLNTITAIINVYAPPSENNTQAYINSVVSDTGLTANGVLTADAGTLALLIRAIVNHELGDSLSAQYVPDADIQTGISMAGNTVSSLAQAAVVAVTNDPSTAVAVIGGLVLIGYLFSGLVRKRRMS